MTGDAIVCDCGRLHDAAEPCPTCGVGEELFDHDCEHFVCPWSDDTCDGCFGELDGDGYCGSPGCEGSTSGDDPDPEPGSWEWERQHGCMDCGVCDDCIERTRAHLEETSDAEVQVLGEGKP